MNKDNITILQLIDKVEHTIDEIDKLIDAVYDIREILDNQKEDK